MKKGYTCFLLILPAFLFLIAARLGPGVQKPPLESDPCQAAFSYVQSQPGEPVMFTDQSTAWIAIVSWTWDFGDGEISHLNNPVHTYAAPGTYQVCLQILEVDGACLSSICQEVVVPPLKPPYQNSTKARSLRKGQE